MISKVDQNGKYHPTGAWIPFWVLGNACTLDPAHILPGKLNAEVLRFFNHIAVPIYPLQISYIYTIWPIHSVRERNHISSSIPYPRLQNGFRLAAWPWMKHLIMAIPRGRGILSNKHTIFSVPFFTLVQGTHTHLRSCPPHCGSQSVEEWASAFVWEVME